jgi:hypothetical protein
VRHRYRSMSPFSSAAAGSGHCQFDFTGAMLVPGRLSRRNWV